MVKPQGVRALPHAAFSGGLLQRVSLCPAVGGGWSSETRASILGGVLVSIPSEDWGEAVLLSVAEKSRKSRRRTLTHITIRAIKEAVASRSDRCSPHICGWETGYE